MTSPDFDIFLSYSHRDRPFVQRLVADLEALDLTVWTDVKELAVGDQVIPAIRRGIDSSRFFAVVLSRHSVASEWVKREVDVATTREVETGKTVVLPVLAESCELPWFLKGKLYADFTHSYDTGFSKLFGAIGSTDKYVQIMQSASLIIDILDTEGRHTNVIRHRSVRGLQGTCQVFTDCFTSENIESIATDPHMDIEKVFSGTVSILNFTLPRLMRPGDVFRYTTTTALLNQFVSGDLSWTLFAPSQSCQDCVSCSNTVGPDVYEFSIVFPQERRCQGYELLPRIGNKIVPNTWPSELTVRGGRQVLTWWIEQAGGRRTSDCTIRWRW